ncbi:MAG TPA: MMPL family transporter [Casimicrobiaceae bacterium]|nr:MMPL family transporter [Casimicrobiaceae bacterium]
MRALITRVVGRCARHAWLVLATAALAGVLASVYAARHIAIDTNTATLISPDLPWRQREIDFARTFPQRVAVIAVVVDGTSPELAEQATSALAKRLAGKSGAILGLRRPDGGPFFNKAGLLFAPTDEVARTTQQMIAAQPLLGTLASDPTLRGVMDALSLVLEGVRREQIKLDDLARPLAAFADALDVVNSGKMPNFSWRTLIMGRAADPRELRRFILVQPALDFGALQPGARAVAAIRDAVQETGFAADPRVRVRLTGPVPLADEEFATLAEGAALNAVVTMLVVVLLLWVALRSGRLIVAILLSLTVGMALTAAFGAYVYGAFNLISVAFAVLFIGLGVDFGIQFCICYRAKRFLHDDLQLALREAGAEVGVPLALAGASTAAGFYAFLPTEYRGVSELGAIAGTGMVIAFVTSVTLLPALLAVLRPGGERGAVGYAAFAPLDRFLSRRRTGVLIAAALLAVGSLALLPQLRFDFNPLNLRSAQAESVATLLDLMKSPDTTPNTIEVLAPNLDAAVALGKRMSALPDVNRALTLASFIPEQQDAKLALLGDAAMLLDPALSPLDVKPPPTDQDTVRAMKRTADALAQAAGPNPAGGAAKDAARLAKALTILADGNVEARERATAALIPGLIVTLDQLRAALQAEPVTLESLPADLKRDWLAPDGRARIEVFPKGEAGDNAAIQRFTAAVRAVAPDATGTTVGIQESSRTIVKAFLEAGLWALLSITALLALTLRRAKDVLLTLAPLSLAGLVTLGTCVAIDLPLNFENIIALPLLFGIGVAFSIYFVMAWRAGATNLLQSSLTRAVLFSALTTGTAFGSLWYSHHPGTASMGKLLALSLAFTLVASLLFLPALLASVRRRG